MDPYDDGDAQNPYDQGEKVTVEAEVNVLLDVTFDERDLELIPQPSRALPAGEIHELMVTDEEDAAEAGRADHVGVIGFMEITGGGVVAAGDEVRAGNETLGTVVGFDATHAPNHYNVVYAADDIESGIESSLELGTTIRFER